MKDNQKVILMIGIPASGKSTWSKEFCKNNPNYIRICRDDYRLMLKNQQICETKIENLITEYVYNSIIAALNNKLNVIIDQTNVKIKYINEFIDLVKYKADLEFKIFDIPKDVAIERDSKREKPVGKDVIEKMYKDYLILFDSNFDFSVRKKLPLICDNYKINISNYSLSDAYIFDVDGTLAHMNNKRGPFDWNKVYLDDVDEYIVKLLRQHHNNGYTIIILSGRDGSCNNLTIKWLNDNCIPFDYLFMRKPNDSRKDSIIKKELYETNIKDKFNILGIYDDRNQVVKMWRSLGLKCFQVADGDF